jgi:pimeloyl-ACP methyl ester carboxylesterase
MPISNHSWLLFECEEWVRIELASGPVLVIAGEADSYFPVLSSTEATSEIESKGLLAGPSVGLVQEVKSAALIIRELVEDARLIIKQRLNGRLVDS